MKFLYGCGAALLCGASLYGAGGSSDLKATVFSKVEAEYPSLLAIYKEVHAHPELSFKEVKTAALVASEWRKLGLEVTEKVGNTGVVGVLRNGPGPTVLVRGDMDGLPVKEDTGLPYASTDVVQDLAGRDQPAMHACGHDAHVTTIVGAARVLTALKDQWSGTIVFVAQPAEEIVAGARAMLLDGLYTRFPKPDYALALHVSGPMPAGEIGYGEGPFLANVGSVDISVKGVGAHGSAPQNGKDPIVLAAQIVLALQTIVSREVEPGVPAVVTVGSIHGGTKHNIISEEVKLQLTLRTYDEKVMQHLIASIRRICDGTARAAGLPEDRLPVVTVTPESAPETVNEALLTRRLGGVFRDWFGEKRAHPTPRVMGAEDFTYFGRSVDKVPICIWWVGTTSPDEIAEAQKAGKHLPGNHSPNFAPVPEPTLKTAVSSMSAAVLELLAK